MTWDSTINLGNVLTLGALILSFAVMHKNNQTMHEANIARMAKIEERLTLIYGWFRASVIHRGKPIPPESDS